MIAWLDSSEDVSRHLRGSIGQGSPAELKSDLFLELLLLVICGFLAALLVVGVLRLCQGRLAIGNKTIKGPIQAWRLKLRMRAVAKNLRDRANEEVIQDKAAWNCRGALARCRRIIARSAKVALRTS